MNKITGGSVVVLKQGRSVEIPETRNFSSPTIFFRKGAIGKVMGLTYESNSDCIIDIITVEFFLCYGVSIQVNVSLDQVEIASSEQVACYCGYNYQ